MFSPLEKLIFCSAAPGKSLFENFPLEKSFMSGQSLVISPLGKFFNFYLTPWKITKFSSNPLEIFL